MEKVLKALAIRSSNVETIFYHEESLMEFHLTLRTHSYLTDKYLQLKSMGYGAIVLRVITLCNSNWLLYMQRQYLFPLTLMEFHQTLQTHSYLQEKYL